MLKLCYSYAIHAFESIPAFLIIRNLGKWFELSKGSNCSQPIPHPVCIIKYVMRCIHTFSFLLVST